MKTFNFQELLAELKKRPTDSETCHNYETQVETLEGRELHDLIFYKEYYSRIKVPKYRVPEESRTDFDWDLLGKLIIGSLSSSYSFERETDEDTPDLLVHVESGENSVTRKISNLFGYQITRLFQIYICEALNFQTLMKTSPCERTALHRERSELLKRWSADYPRISGKARCKELSDIRNQLNKYIVS